MAYLDWYNLFATRLAVDLEPIAGFGCGTPTEAINAEGSEYPLLWLEAAPLITYPQNATGTVQTNIANWQCAFYILDKGLEGGEQYDSPQRQHLIDRCQGIANACISYIYKFTEATNATLGSVSIQPLIDDFADRTTGVRVELTLQLPDDWNWCALPLGSFTPGPGVPGGGTSTFCALVSVCTQPLEDRITALEGFDANICEEIANAGCGGGTAECEGTPVCDLIAANTLAIEGNTTAISGLTTQVNANTNAIAALQIDSNRANNLSELWFGAVTRRWQTTIGMPGTGTFTAANALWLWPFIAGNPTGLANLTKIGIFRTTTTAVNYRYALYTNVPGSLQPALLVASGTGTTVAAAGLYEAVLAATPLTTGQIYWVAFQFDEASYIIHAVNTQINNLFRTPAAGQWTVRHTVTFATALPADLSATALTINSQTPPVIYLDFA